ncbi:hypothetical protein BHM03_00032789 [Ensete ventricosum]|nr:hypothetical protein BHM03_00032789 [Ensete ventricosum]
MPESAAMIDPRKHLNSGRRYQHHAANRAEEAEERTALKPYICGSAVRKPHSPKPFSFSPPPRRSCVARSQTDPLADHNHDTRRTTTAFCGPHRQHAPIGGSTWPVRKWGRSTSEWVDCGPGVRNFTRAYARDNASPSGGRQPSDADLRRY